MIIVGICLDIKESQAILLEHSDGIVKNQCYMNVFDLVYSKAIKDVLIAFGYYGEPSIGMIRHCYFMLKDKTAIIDPTIVAQGGRIFTYHTFKTYTIEEYKNVIESHLSSNKRKGFNASFKTVLKDEERLYCEFAIKNSVHIDLISYSNFMSPYDPIKEVNISTYFNKETTKYVKKNAY
jgi:hypothetical protein